MRATIHSLPTELVISIMVHSNTSILALACTCRRFHSIYQTRELQLLYPMLKSNPDIKLLMLLVETLAICTTDCKDLEDAPDFRTATRLGSRRISAEVARYAVRLQGRVEVFYAAAAKVVAESKLRPMPPALTAPETLRTSCYMYLCFAVYHRAYSGLDMDRYTPPDVKGSFMLKHGALRNWLEVLWQMEDFADNERVARGGLSCHQWRSLPENARPLDCAVNDNPSIGNGRDTLGRYIVYKSSATSFGGRRKKVHKPDWVQYKLQERVCKARASVVLTPPCRDLRGF